VGSQGQKKWARIRRMTWAEVRTRVGQEVSKRLDLASYRTGLIPRTKHLRQNPARANFFFGEGESELWHRATLLRTHLPKEVDGIIHEADEICAHKFHLLGHEKLDYGPTIDWHSDPVNGKRSPLRPWFKLPFLDFNVVGDHKVIWELNRHQHLVTLAKAWVLTRNFAYAKECAAQFYSWQLGNPYPLGINWASTLEVAFRSTSWLWVRFLLASCPELPAQFPIDLLHALQFQGRYIERYLSIYFSPNTHLLGEAVALFFLGTVCPQIPGAERWQRKGWKILLEEAERQVRPDGVYFEQSLYYHVYALDFFLHARILAIANGLTVPESFDGILNKMLDVVHALSAVGPPEGFGDDDGGRVFNPRRNRLENMMDPLALGAVLYRRNDYASAALSEEAVWLFGQQAVDVLGKQHTATSTHPKAFEAGGIYLMNDSDPFIQQMAIDAGPQGTGHSGHGHADALSIRYSIEQRRFLIDSGTYCYVSNRQDRNWFRGTGAHNTLRVDGIDQAVPEGPFEWSSIPNVKAQTWVSGRTFEYFVGSHDGYFRLSDPVLHRRIVFHVKGGFWFIRDVAEGRGHHLVETFWHFAPDLELGQERGVFFAESAVKSNARCARLALLLDQDSGWAAQIGEGLASPAYGAKQAAPVVRISADVTLPSDCGVLLLPMIKADGAGTLSAMGSVEVRGYRYQAQQSKQFLLFASANAVWRCGDWSSDAELRFTHVIMVGGTFAEWRGKRFVSHPPQDKTFEWVADPGSRNQRRSGASDSGVIAGFDVFDSVS
jgi:hypothetical protein